MRGFPADEPIVADARLALSALLATVSATIGVAVRSGRRHCASAWPSCGGRRWRRTGACWPCVQAALPDAVIVGDQTQPVYAGNQFYAPERPRSWFNSSTGYGTLGYALPAAIGA